MRKQLTAPDILRRAFLSWLAAALAEFLFLPESSRSLEGLEALAGMSPVRAALLWGGVFALLTVLALLVDTRRAERWGVAAVTTLLGFTGLRASFTWPMLGACALLFAVTLVYALRGWDATPEPAAPAGKARRAWVWVTLGLTAAFFLLVSAWTVGRYVSFGSPTYDFGIFSQMFYSMRATGLPITTLERDGALSHFAVHVSPVYYLMLPFYALFPDPAVLQILQAAVMASAVIPLWLLGRQHGLTGAQRTLCCAVLLLTPAFAGGAGYDLHENCFLTPLILWLFYGVDRKNAALTALAAALTLSVKEDAAVYVAVVGVWLAVSSVLRPRERDRRGLVTGLALLCAALGWFALVTGYLAKSGDGVMTYRYANFMYDGSDSLVTVVKAALLCPLKAVYECVDAEKLRYIALTLLPVLGLPLMTRRYERFILLIPYVLVNLMSDYRYQHDILFQYSFGSTAFLLYLTVVNGAELRPDWRRLLDFAGAAAVGAVCFGCTVAPVAVSYPARAIRYHGYYQDIRAALDRIPEDASVSATTYYTAYLSRRPVLYDVRYGSREHLLETQYVVLRLNAAHEYRKFETGGAENGLENLIRLLEGQGYQEFARVDGELTIYRKEQNASPAERVAF